MAFDKDFINQCMIIIKQHMVITNNDVIETQFGMQIQI